jgi:hypothetical protein
MTGAEQYFAVVFATFRDMSRTSNPEALPNGSIVFKTP